MTKKKYAHPIHLLERVNIATEPKEYIVYKCGYPNCTYYIQEALAVGKESICHGCGQSMILDKYIMWGKRIKPKCPSCRGKDKEETKAFEEFLKQK